MKKKLVIAGIILILAMVLMGTCSPELTEEDDIEYTDVVYSKDGSEITVYLDGETVPVSKSQRAMTLGLSMMSYDYLEVVFVVGTAVSRSAWELGQPAGISGAGLRITGSNYNGFTGTQQACLFAGQKSGKTLFGVGKLVKVTNKTGAPISNGNGSGTVALPITSDTLSVTFALSAIQTGLIIAGESVGARGTVADSFKYDTALPTTAELNAGGRSDGATYNLTSPADAPKGYTTMVGNSSLQTLGGVEYPAYALPLAPKTATGAKYTFDFFVNKADYLPAVRHISTADTKPKIQKRTPRFMDGGRYLQPNGHVDTKTTVEFLGASYPATVGGPFESAVPLVFRTEPGSGGIFSFFLEIPVFNLNNTYPATLNGGDSPITWWIRTGLGADLYSLDDGESSGGCVLMSSGVSTSDWLEIETTWIVVTTP